MTVIEKRRSFIINIIYASLIILIFYFIIKYAVGICFPFIFAFIVALILQRPINAIVRKTKLKKGFTSVIMVLLVLAILIAFIVLLGGKIVSECSSFINLIKVKFNDINWLQKNLYKSVAFLPGFIRNNLDYTIDKFISQLHHVSSSTAGTSVSKSSSFDFSKLFSSSMSGVWNTAKQIPSILLAILITIISCCFITADYDRIVTSIMKLFPENKRFLFSKSKEVMFKSIGKLMRAYAKLMFIIFMEMVVALYIFKFMGLYKGNFVFPIAALTAVAEFLPVVGLGAILIPWAIYSFIIGNSGLGIALFVLFVVMVGVRHIIEPKLVADQLDMPPILSIMAMYIGLEVFGGIGMVLLPILVFIFKILYDDGVIFSKKLKNNDNIEELDDSSGMMVKK